MEVSLMEDELRQFENPSLVSDLLRSTDTGSWIWGVLLLAAAAAAAAVVGLLLSKIQLLRFRRHRSVILRLPSFYSSGEDDDDASTSSSDGEGEEEEEEKDKEVGKKNEEEEENEIIDFSLSSFSLADLIGGMGVVKDWEGLGLESDRSSGSVSLIDLSRGEILRSFNGGAGEMPVVDLASQTEILSAVDEGSGSVVRLWDARARDEAPAAIARPLLRRRVAGVSAGEGKIYIGDDDGEVATMDLRNMSAVDGGEGFGSWWRNAARCLTILSPRLDGA